MWRQVLGEQRQQLWHLFFVGANQLAACGPPAGLGQWDSEVAPGPLVLDVVGQDKTLSPSQQEFRRSRNAGTPAAAQAAKEYQIQ